MGKKYKQVSQFRDKNKNSICEGLSRIETKVSQLIRVGAISLVLLGTSGLSQRTAFLHSLPAKADVVADTTLPTATQVNANTALTGTPTINGFVITGGTSAGRNLFHSFSSFSPDTTPTEFRLTDPTIRNIFSRVTGDSVFNGLPNTSSLNGLLTIDGGNAPNLFLLNPHGVFIGPSASINIPGSLFLSTADRVLFDTAGSTFFSAADTAGSLLTVSVPVGVQFGAAAAPITAQGRFTSPLDVIYASSPNDIPPQNYPSTYTFTPTTSLTLLGGDLDLKDAYFRLPSGRIQLGSVAPNSRVNFNEATHALTYLDNTIGQNITLTGSVADVSSNDSGTSGGGGNLQVTGQQVTLQDGAALLSTTRGTVNGGKISVTAFDRLNIGSSAIGSVVAPVVTGREPQSSANPLGQPQPGDPISFTPSTARGSDISITAPIFNGTENMVISAETASVGTGGDIHIQADTAFTLTGAAAIDPLRGISTVLTTLTYGRGMGGNLTINTQRFVAQGSLRISTAAYRDVRSPVLAPDLGDGGNLTINTDTLQLLDAAQIGSGTFGSGDSGELNVHATTSVEIAGALPLVFQGQLVGQLSSGLFSSAERGSTGNGGSLRLTTPQLTLRDGGKLGGGTNGSGDAGDITIRAADIVVSDPIRDFGGELSGIAATVTQLGTGSGGQLNIVSDRIRVLNGGQITASTNGSGNAGDLNLQARVIEVSGTSADGQINSRISSRSTTPFDAGTVTISGFNGQPLADNRRDVSGLNSAFLLDRLVVEDEGSLSVSSVMGGTAGNLKVTANSIVLNDGSIQAEADAGDQGNLTLTSRDILLLRQGSNITTNATQQATGGNITLNSPIIIGTENSDISANALQGDGGNISLITQGLIGIAFRDLPTPQSDITATSETGVNGTVNIESPNVESDSGLVQLPENLTDTSNQVATGCAADAGNQFTNSGRGGLPTNPSEYVSSNRPWQDIRTAGIEQPTAAEKGDALATHLSEQTTDVLIEASR